MSLEILSQNDQQTGRNLRAKLLVSKYYIRFVCLFFLFGFYFFSASRIEVQVRGMRLNQVLWTMLFFPRHVNQLYNIGGQHKLSRQPVTFLSPAVGNSSQWLLCHRASTHDWAVKTFHERCDNKNHTVTIIKKGQYVFGGYTDIAWGK